MTSLVIINNSLSYGENKESPYSRHWPKLKWLVVPELLRPSLKWIRSKLHVGGKGMLTIAAAITTELQNGRWQKKEK